MGSMTWPSIYEEAEDRGQVSERVGGNGGMFAGDVDGKM